MDLWASTPGDARDNDLASTLYNFGFLYSDMGGGYDLQESVEMHKKSLDLYSHLEGQFLIKPCHHPDERLTLY